MFAVSLRRHPARRKTTEKKQRNIEVQVEIHNKIEIQEQTQGGDTRRNRPQEEVPLAREEPAAREHEPGRELHDNKVLPDVTNLTLVSTQNTSFTVSWERPKNDFDYYRVEVTSSTNEDVQPYRVGSCSYGSVVDAHQTQVTCDQIEPCTNVTFKIRTYAKGPPERASSGVALDHIVVPGQGPGSPGNVSISWLSNEMSRLTWTYPENVSGTIQGYRLSICHRYQSCDVEQEMTSCGEYLTSGKQLHFPTTRETQYCVRLTLVSAGDRSFTVSWERPVDKFDYYRVQVIGSGGVAVVGSCANGTIIDANKTQVTCDNVEDCSNVTFKLRTYNKGPPERGSFNTAFKRIFIPGPVPDSPSNVSILGISPSLSRLQWEPSQNVSGTLRDYTVRTCSWYWDCAKSDSTSCVEHRTPNNWFYFDTTDGMLYCVQVKANTLCGDRVITSHPATSEVIARFLGEKVEK
ncbi:hypothetical protein MTO96_050449 [Rhipicephalus appendiculatus]